MCCILYDARGEQPATSSTQTALAGTLVSSLHRLKDIDNSGALFIVPSLSPRSRDVKCASDEGVTTDGGFFVFGDLSVKIEGEFRLLFSLYEMLKYASFLPSAGR